MLHIKRIILISIIGISSALIPVYVFAADQCATDADCVSSGLGNSCKAGRSRGSEKRCIFSCNTSSDCQTGQTCEEDTAGLRGFRCVGPVPKAGNGQECTVTTDCSTGLTCIDTTDSRGGSRKCYAICNTDNDCSNGNSCSEVQYTRGQNICTNTSITPGGQGTRCENTTDCQPGLVCNKGNALGRSGLCALPSTDPTTEIKNDYEGIPFSIPSTQSVRVTSAQSLPELIGKGLRLFTGFFGSIALIMVIYGGLQIMTAAGQSEKIKQGGKIIAWASIGLITMMLSYLLVSFVFGAIA